MERPSNHGNYDPLVAIDHSAVCEDFFLSMKGNASAFVHADYERQIQLQRPVFQSFEYVARLMHEVNVDDTLSSDTTQVAVFKSGVTFALGVLEQMAASIGVEVDDFYKHWETTSVVMLPPEAPDQSRVDKIKAATSLIKEAAEIHLNNLPDEYTRLIKKAQVNYAQIEDRTEIFQTGYGYVLGSGYTALQYLYERQSMGEIDFESIFDEDWAAGKEAPTHQSLANKFVRLIESDDEETDIETIFGLVMRDNADKNEDLFEVFHSLAIAIYRDVGERGMDDVTEAFFTGANLGAHIATDLGETQLGDAAFIQRWLKTKLHSELSKFGPDEYDHTRIDAKKAFEKLRNTAIPGEYTQLLGLINEEYEYDDEDSEAFREGFRYALVTLLNQIESQKKGVATRTARAEMENFQEEFDTFMQEYDLTGNLQNVYVAYLEHCKAFDLDSDNLTHDEAETILELTLEDYDRLMPEMTEVEVRGPSFLQVLDGEDDDISATLLQKGDTLKGEIVGFRLSVAPADDSYSNPETISIEQFPLRYVPSYVLRDAELILSDGSRSAEGKRIVVGFAVPGTQFRRTDF